VLSLQRHQNRPVDLLLVEDNPGDVLLLKIGLEGAKATYRLHVAEDGEQAIQLLAGELHRPDLILLDLNLPKRTGHEVLKFIKGHKRFQVTPVVVLTSSSSPLDIATAYQFGANSYLQKPTSIDETLDLIRTIEHYWLDLAMLPTNP
jgi:two-component system, chemotaxis family, response regulator Rcp1